MIKVFIPEIKGRIKTSVRGFWYSKECAKIYYDYLKVKEYTLFNAGDNYYLNRFFDYLELLKKSYGQECIVYTDNNVLNVFYNRNKIEVLSNRIYAEVKPEGLRKEIRAALKAYNGITIYREGKRYFKEVFY